MSRSYKKQPGGSNCNTSGQKEYRSQENRAKRRRVRVAIILEKEMPAEKEYGNEWSSPRDGKQYWVDYDPKWMRK